MVDDVPYLDPLTSRLPKNARQRTHILRAHRYAVENGDQTYLDPDTGLHVMTAVTLWENGTCCKSGCRHCPYHHGPRTGETNGT